MQQQQQQQTIAPEEKKSVQFTPSTTTPQQHTQQHSKNVHERSDLLMKTTVAKDLNQIRGLFLKSFFLQLKQYKTNLCQLLFPVMCLVFIFILQAVLNTLVAGFLSSAGTDGIVRINSTSVELSQLMLQAKQLQTGKNITFSPPEAIYVTSDKVGYLDSIGFGVLSPNLTLSNGFLKNIAPFSRMSSTLAVNGTFNSTGWVSIPYSVSSPFTEETSMDEVIYDHMGAVSKPENLDAVGGYIVRQLSISDKVSTKTTFNYTVEYDYDEKTQFCKSYIKKTPYSFAIKSCKDAIGVGLQNWMNDAFIRNITGSYRIKTYTAQMPYDTEVSTFQIADLLGFFFFPMILCLLLPSFSFTIVLEKQFKLREMMKLMGMKMRYYFLVTYVFFYLLYCISAALFIIFCLIFRFRFITQTNPFMLFLFFIAWGNTLVSFGFLLSSFIGKTIVATIISYLIVLIMPMVGIILETAVYTNVPEARFGILTIFPLQITHFVYATSNACNSYECLKKVSDIYDNQSVFYSLIYMVGMSVVYFILGLYFDAVVPQPFGVSRHPLFFLEWIWKPFTRNRVKSKNGASKNRVSPCSKDEKQDEEIIVDAVKGESLDSDVAEEYFKVNPPGYDNKQMQEHVKKMREEYGVVLFNLEKTYGMNRAVKGTCLTIGKSECFGLLGMNGAGKSTTISMLSGMFGPSAGTAYVYNKDIRYDMESIHKMMGLTAQFDILYPDLTCEEHLLFYCRLKGIQLKHEKEHIQSLLRQVGLDNDTLKTKWSPNSSSLSGGMKRRLSIAISLVGDPNVILLDEPTTGLDPLSKRHLWDIILAQKKNRTIILTTHSMEEADVLCDRITIMNKGSFKCLGSGVRLKSKFGDGFLLTVSYGLTSQETAEKYVYDYVPEAQKDLTLTGTTTFKIPFFNTNKQIGEEQIADNRSIAGLFQHMESGKLNHGIKEWALNQVSLEQVFLNIVSKDSEKRSQAEKDVKCAHKRSSVLIRQCLC